MLSRFTVLLPPTTAQALATLTIVIAAFLPRADAAPAFTGLQLTYFTDNLEDRMDKYPAAISGDGSVVVGSYYSGGAYKERPFLWSKATGLLPLAGSGAAVSVSADGKTVVGYLEGPKRTRIPARWTVTGRKVTQTLLPQGAFPSGKNIRLFHEDYPSGSADLSVLGWNTTNDARITRQGWVTENDILSKVGPFFENSASLVTAVSLDGKHLAGISGDPGSFGNAPVKGNGFATSPSDPTAKIAPLGSDRFSYATGISADGSVVIGNSVDANGTTTAFRWTKANGLSVGFGKLYPDVSDYESNATGISADGNFVVGNEPFPYSSQFVWSPESGLQNLDQLLTQNGIELSTFFDSVDVIAVSADGTTVLCSGFYRTAFISVTQPFLISGFPKRGSFEFVSPTVRIRGPREIVTSAKTVTIRGMAADTNLDSISWRIGKGAWRTFAHGKTWAARIRGLRPGKNTISFRASDKTGNSSTQSVTVQRK